MSQTNTVSLTGTIMTAPCFEYRSGNRNVYCVTLSVLRLSMARDLLPVYLWEEQLLPFVCSGSRVYIEGAMRSYSSYSEGRNRLSLYVQCYRIGPATGADCNSVFLLGQIARAPVYRRTPFGREICDIMLSVRRNAYKSEFLPCIIWGPLARRVANMRLNEPLRLEGRFQSREYEKQLDGGAVDLRTAYEVSCVKIY